MEKSDFPSRAEQMISSPEFIELNDIVQYRTPNFWHIIGIARKEVYTSRFLAWMLNPGEDHSLGDRFLRAFLSRALKSEQGSRSQVLSVEMEVADLNDTEVFPEYYLGNRRCDILVKSAKKKLIVVIENKIDAKESQDQTRDYHHNSFEEFPEASYPNRIYIFLTANGEPAKCDHFIAVSYQDILQVMGDVQRQKHLDENTLFFVKQFKEYIQREIAMDQRTRDLIDDIYAKYGDVIRFITQNIADQDPNASDPAEVDSSWDGKT